jgi:hypothetical protein
VCGDTLAPDKKSLSYNKGAVLTHEKGDLYLEKRNEYHLVEVPHGTQSNEVRN